MAINRKGQGFFYIGLLLIIFLVFTIHNNGVYAQSNEITLQKPTHLNMKEFAHNIDNKESNSSISLPMPSPTWNLTQIHLNFSNIRLDRETNIIEDNTTVGFHTLGRDIRGLGVQIDIFEPTKIFGVYLYGVAPNPAIVEVTEVQIRGYNPGGLNPDSPNKTIFGSTELNMSNVLGWHLQTFPDPIDLPIGQYYLIMNYTQLVSIEGENIYWFYNNISPKHPELHISFYIRDLGIWHWTRGDLGSPFLHKIIQRTNKTYFPESINMTAKLDNQIYNISNGFEIGTGNLTIGPINYNPGSNRLKVQILNNNSVDLLFNLNYNLHLSNVFFSDGALLLRENTAVNWTLNPHLDKIYSNYSVKFDYPQNWFNLKVFKDGADITSQVEVNYTNNYIYIPENEIDEGANWEITANSPNIDLSLNIPKRNFEPSQELKYSVYAQSLDGNYTFILIDSLNFEIDRKEVPVVLTETVYNYSLSANPNEGTYTAYVFWYNLTSAGMRMELFTVNIDIFPLLVFLISIIGSISAAVTYTSYKLTKKIKRAREEYRKSIYNKYMDILNLEYLIIIDKNSGLNIYDKIFASKTIDASLISGFLEAIRNFGIDLTGSNQQSQTVKLEYQESKIIMSEFKNFRMTVIMKENPSGNFLDSIKKLSYDIEDNFGKELGRFDGDVSKFFGIKDIIERHLPVSLIYPLKINESKAVKLNSKEEQIIKLALGIMKEKNMDYFFVSNLISLKGEFQAKDAELILNLIEKKIFRPTFEL
jgi:hypothetical protein